jgi:hypothetical protein
MKCPTCEGEGQKSNVYPGGTFSTLMFNHPYWDADGVYHFHDMNSHSTSFSCSRGHDWVVKSKNRCPAAGCTYELR